jgi:hypothetical protein
MALPPHIPVAVKMLPHLVECAKDGRMTSYEEIAVAINAPSRLFSRPLAFIRDFICAGHNLPPLTVLVQKKGPDTASNSYDPAQFAALTQQEYKARQKEAVKSVHSYPRWDQALTGLQDMFRL